MKKQLYRILTVSCVFLIIGCQDYDYDFENGYEVGDEDPSTITIDTSGFEVDRSQYDKARIFPGLVDEREPRIDTTINFNFNKKFVSAFELGVKTVPEPIISTGLYAAPGELVRITIPSGLYGITAQIGSHMDDLSDISPSRREPLIYNVKELIPGVNNLRNPFGGYIWLRIQFNLQTSVDIKFQGAVKAPDYVSGSDTSVEQWKNDVLNSYVPWLELRAPHIAFSVPRSLVQNAIENGKLNNVDELLLRWEKIITEDYYQFIGLEINSSDNSKRAPDFPERAVLDAQLEGSVYIRDGGQPIVAQMDQYWFNEWTNLESINSGQSWGTFRSLGYNYELALTPFWSTLTESTPNLYAFKIAGVENDLPTLGNNGVLTQFPLALDYAQKTEPKYFDLDDEASNWIFKLTPFIQLFHNISNPATGEDGFALYPYLLEKLNNTDFPPTNDMSKRNFFFIGLSEFTQIDYSSFFDAWGIAISDFARATASTYPALSTELWKYNPITKQGGDTPVVPSKYFHNRTDWVLSASSEAPNETFPNGLVAALIDGNPNTFWHSCYSDCEPAVTLPHKIYVDMQQLNSISGFYIASRVGSTHPKGMQLFGSADGTNYTDLGFYELEDSNYRQFIDFPEDETFRYLRIEIPTNDYSDRLLAAISEIGTYRN